MCVPEILQEIQYKIYSLFILRDNENSTYAHKDNTRKDLYSCMSIGICSAILQPLPYIMIYRGLGMTEPHAIQTLLYYLIAL